MPDDGNLANQFGEWVTDEAMQQRILVDNPARLTLWALADIRTLLATGDEYHV